MGTASRKGPEPFPRLNTRKRPTTSSPVYLAAGSEFCPAVGDAVRASQLLLLSLDFEGLGEYLPPGADSEDRDLADFLAQQMVAYNQGTLCR
jgi:hypothetical protein